MSKESKEIEIMIDNVVKEAIRNDKLEFLRIEKTVQMNHGTYGSVEKINNYKVVLTLSDQ